MAPRNFCDKLSQKFALGSATRSHEDRRGRPSELRGFSAASYRRTAALEYSS